MGDSNAGDATKNGRNRNAILLLICDKLYRLCVTEICGFFDRFS
jgi:hypothetical protein